MLQAANTDFFNPVVTVQVLIVSCWRNEATHFPCQKLVEGGEFALKEIW